MNDLTKFDYHLPTGPIFHYTSASGLMGILEHNKIWATNIFYLNDSAELVHAINRVKEQILHSKDHLSKEDCEFLDMFANELDEIIQKFSIRLFDLSQTIYVCCFSEERNQLSQWRSYCPEGNGYSIGFEFVGSLYNRIMNKRDGRRFNLRKCLYTEAEQEEFASLFLKHELGIFRGMKNSSDSNIHDIAVASATLSRMDFLEYAPMLKNEKFREEAEVRLISVPHIMQPDEKDQIRFRTGKSTLVPYVEIELAEPGNLLPISKIVVGPTPYPQLSENALQSLLALKGYNPNLTESCRIPYRGGGIQI